MVPMRPRTGERNVCTAVVLVLVSDEAPWIQSLTTTSTPRPAASLFAATATALKKLSGPSAESAVDGRIDAVNTTGFLDLITRFRKYAVSSIVSVPCVMTTPATSG